jgi:helicase SWR1
LRHDSIESQELLAFEHPLPNPKEPCVEDLEDYDKVPRALKVLAKELCIQQHTEKIGNIAFLNQINSARCSASPFPYAERVLEAVRVPKQPLHRSPKGRDPMSSPAHLLAMRRDQQDRAEDLSEIVKKFVICVPKAGSTPPSMDCKTTSNATEKAVEEMLLEPIHECLRPFREANSRLSSFFPDKKLIQYDSGKLQMLAELLRERKRGGHKVLIFTQMGKMVNMLWL